MKERSPTLLVEEMTADLVASLDLCRDVACPKCLGKRLELHQPDLSTPDRLLGICPRCHSWSLVDQVEDGLARLTLLPDLV